MTEFLEEDSDKKKPPIPAARITVGKKADDEISKPPSLDPVLKVAPTARAVGARINRLMAEQNNNEFGVEVKPRAEKDQVGASSDVLKTYQRSKYLGLDDAEREVTAVSPSKRKEKENRPSSPETKDEKEIMIVSNLKPIPALRRIESEKIKEDGETGREENEGKSSRLSPSKVVSKGTLERKETGTTTGKPTLFVKPMIKPQVRDE